MVGLRGVFFAAALLLPVLAGAEVVGYAINSDDEQDADQLLRIDLQTGEHQLLGPLPARFSDVEGLAFNLDDQLLGADSASKSLIRISIGNGAAQSVNGGEFNLGFPPTSSLDFGMTFTCSGQLLLVAEQTGSLYELDPESGAATVIGDSGGLGDSMTAIASHGEDTFALADNGRFYAIDVAGGTATLLGTLDTGFEFTDAGMAFDAEGTLWAISSDFSFERSRIFTIDIETLEIQQIARTRTGIESLAITGPVSCGVLGAPAPVEVPIDAPWMLVLLALVLLALGRRSLLVQRLG